MGFDIKKYCHIDSVLHQKGNKPIEFNHSGINLFFVVSGSCSADANGTVLEVKKEETGKGLFKNRQ